MPELSSPETAERVRCALARYAQDGRCAASIRDLGEELSIGRTTAHNAIRRLLTDGVVEVLRKGTGHRYPTLYALREEHS